MYEESEKIELKETLIPEIKNEINGFLNSKGGTIYVGVDNDGVVKPIINSNKRDDIDSKLSNWVREAFHPMPLNLINYYFNEDNVFVIEVKQGTNKPYFIREKGPKPSGVYIREGRSTRKATESEILLMIMASNHYSYESDISEEQELTFKYFRDVCKENVVECDKRHFKSLGMISKDGKYTNLGLLMSDQCPIVVKFAKYDKDLNFIVKAEHTGCLIKILNDVLEHANLYNTVSAIIDGRSFKRIEKESFPNKSLREAILNAFAHCNYFIHSNIKVEFFDDRAVVTNPGGIYEATLEEILDGVQTWRNPRLVNLMHKLHFVENFGSGLPRIIEAYKKSEIKPIFKPSNNFFRVVLHDMNYTPEKANVPNNVPNVPNNVPNVFIEDEEKIIGLIIKNSKCTREEMAALIGKTEKTVQRLLKKSKRIKRIGGTRGHWEVIK